MRGEGWWPAAWLIEMLRGTADGKRQKYISMKIVTAQSEVSVSCSRAEMSNYEIWKSVSQAPEDDA